MAMSAEPKPLGNDHVEAKGIKGSAAGAYGSDDVAPSGAPAFSEPRAAFISCTFMESDRTSHQVQLD